MSQAKPVQKDNKPANDSFQVILESLRTAAERLK